MKEHFLRLRYTTAYPKAGKNDLKGMDSQTMKDRKYSRMPVTRKARELGTQRTEERVWGHHTGKTEGLGKLRGILVGLPGGDK